jgi:ribulose-5-phosphate 4-epimerase/fuculose-1-phosphate aldolase
VSSGRAPASPLRTLGQLGVSVSGSDDAGLPEQVAAATRALGAADQQDLIWGHISARDPEGRGAWMKAAGFGFDEITADRIVLVGWRGEVLAGTGRRHAEYPIHAEILRARPEVNWVVHTHAAPVNVFSSLNLPLRAISHDAVLFCEPQLPRFSDGDLITTAERGHALATTLGTHIACLLPFHGLVCTGRSTAQAVMHAVLLTRACAAMIAATAAGGPATWSSDFELAAKRETTWPDSQLDAGYAYLLRASQRA